MSQRLQELLRDIELHPEAERLANQFIEDFKLILFTEAVTVAGEDRVILNTHMRNACTAAYQKKYEQSLKKQWANAVGGVCLGAFIPGFFTELSNRNDVLLFIFTLLGLLGVALLTWGFQQ